MLDKFSGKKRKFYNFAPFSVKTVTNIQKKCSHKLYSAVPFAIYLFVYIGVFRTTCVVVLVYIGWCLAKYVTGYLEGGGGGGD